ncbi:MAG TPA: peptidase M64 [Bacteroidales bacterium]|nr:peptidase M64 [Bacteroidales bacterium]
MKKAGLFTFLFLSTLFAFGQFDLFFSNGSLRLDYTHAGNATEEFYYLDEWIAEPYWGGSKTKLIDTFKYGKYFFEVYDKATGTLIYSRGYSSLFAEWQTTIEAQNVSKSFEETILFPMPKNAVFIKLYSRNWQGELQNKIEFEIDPKDYFIKHGLKKEYPVYQALVQGEPENKVDIVILPEGYTKEEMDLFIRDCDKFAKVLFDYSPYSEHKKRFNISGVLAPSEESGSDIPKENSWRNTLLGTSFYTFDSERYCMTTENKAVRDVAANVPYDQIYILVNTEKYGGGAILNHYNVSVNSNQKAGKIFIHELGHGFAGLGDEYYDSSTSYNDFYNLEIEPWEPNITTLKNFDSKWGHLILKNVPIPTPDSVIYEKNMGVFEGGGYSAKGIYRPKKDCLMKSFDGDVFCEACAEAIVKMINFYSK